MKISCNTVVFSNNHGCPKGAGEQGFTPPKKSISQGYFHKKKKKRKEKKIELKQLSNSSTAHLFIAYYNLYPATWNLIVTALSNDTVSQDTKIKEELKMITMTTTYYYWPKNISGHI